MVFPLFREHSKLQMWLCLKHNYHSLALKALSTLLIFLKACKKKTAWPKTYQFLNQYSTFCLTESYSSYCTTHTSNPAHTLWDFSALFTTNGQRKAACGKPCCAYFLCLVVISLTTRDFFFLIAATTGVKSSNIRLSCGAGALSQLAYANVNRAGQ